MKPEELLKEIFDIAFGTEELANKFTDEEARACDQALSEIIALIEDNTSIRELNDGKNSTQG